MADRSAAVFNFQKREMQAFTHLYTFLSYKILRNHLKMTVVIPIKSNYCKDGRLGVSLGRQRSLLTKNT